MFVKIEMNVIEMSFLLNIFVFLIYFIMFELVMKKIKIIFFIEGLLIVFFSFN